MRVSDPLPPRLHRLYRVEPAGAPVQHLQWWLKNPMDNTEQQTRIISNPSSGAANPNQQNPHQHSPEQSGSASPGAGAAQQGGAEEEKDASGTKENVVVKIAMVGDAQIGKTSLMVKYVEGLFSQDYIQSLGVNFMEKTVAIRNAEITFSIWDLGGQQEFVNMLPLVCNDAAAILFMFDLTRIQTLANVKEWYRQARGFNKGAAPLLVGLKYDEFSTFPIQEQAEVTRQARKYARAMKAPLIFSSASHSINIQKVFKIILSRVFDLKLNIPRIDAVGEPILEY